nr:GntR family transcriptional regulator [Pedobacter panaciterrae]
MKNYLKIIKINPHSLTPKYLQIYNSVLAGIKEGKIGLNDVLPSINDLSTALEVAKITTERAYKDLKKIGVVDSVPGKGCFIASVDFEQPVKLLLLFNKLSNHKKIIYDAMVKKLGKGVAIDFYIYNNDVALFKSLIKNKAEFYHKVALIPHFFNSDDGNICQIIKDIPREKLILMDKLVTGITGDFCAVYEDFENDIYGALKELSEQLARYHMIKMIFPANSYYSKSILTGFINFCVRYGFDYEILSNLAKENLSKGTVYINLMEDDLVELVEKLIGTNLVIGADIGIISYNETSIKKIVLNGITTISTDFVMMGETAAEMVLGQRNDQVIIPFRVMHRRSL